MTPKSYVALSPPWHDEPTEDTPLSGTRFGPMDIGIKTQSDRIDTLCVNVKDYGALGDGSTNDTAALQAAINVKGLVFFPPGNYVFSALTITADTVLMGCGKQTVLTHTSTSSHAISGSGVTRVGIRDMYIQGAGSGTVDGLHLTKGGNADVPYVSLSNVSFVSFGQDGISIENPIVSSFINVLAVTNGRYGFNLYGQTGGASGTSCSLVSCYGNANTTAGYRLYNLTYTALKGCAADANPIGYLIDSCQGMSVGGCGAESNVTNSFKITGSYSIMLSPVWVYNNRGVGVYVTGGSDAITITAMDNSPNGTATNFIKVDSGSNSTLLSCKNVTANNVPSTTTTIIPAGAGPTFGNYTTILASGEADGDWTTFGGDLIAGSPGRGLKVKEGTNAKMGTAVLSGGTATVSTTVVTTTSRIFLTAQATGGTAGALRVSARTAGTSFTITSTSGTDTSTVAWMIVEPA